MCCMEQVCCCPASTGARALVCKNMHCANQHKRGVHLLLMSILGADTSEGGMNVNFPQLLEDGRLEQQLQSVADVPALQDFVATWLAQQWPQLEAGMLAGRAVALDRWDGGAPDSLFA